MKNSIRTRTSISIQKWTYMIIGTITVLMIAVQLLFQNYLVQYVGNIYLTNINAGMESIANDVHETFSKMSGSVEYLAEHQNVKDYARTANTETRYQKAFDNVRPIVEVATQNLNVDQLLISDVTGARFEFLNGNLSQQAWETLQKQVRNPNDLVNTVINLDGSVYFCTIKPVLVWENSNNRQVGLVAMRSSVDKLRPVFEEYDDMRDMTILLHNFDTVLVSNRPELEGLPLAELPVSNELLLEREKTILPDSLSVVISIPQSKVFLHRTSFALTFLVIGCFLLLLILLMATFANRLIVRPFTHVIDETSSLGTRDLDRRLTATGVSHVDELVDEINGMLNRLENYSRRVFATQQHLYEMELRQQETQMYLLRNQINRHFLYNSLISIRALADHGETGKVKEVAGGIAQLFRYVTSGVKEVNLFDEMEIVNRYVNIQNIRFDDKVKLELDVDDRLCDYKILRLLLQPLVENALVHGLEKQTAGCVLTLRGFFSETGIRIEVEDNGKGIPADLLEQIQQNLQEADCSEFHHDLHGIALVNIQKRIHIAYGTEYGLELQSEEGRCTRVALNIPAIPDSEREPEPQ